MILESAKRMGSLIDDLLAFSRIGRAEAHRTTFSLQQIVQEVAADIRAKSFAAREGFICRSCAYKPICPAHEETLN